MDVAALIQRHADEAGEMLIERAARATYALDGPREELEARTEKWRTLAPALRETYRERARLGYTLVSMWMAKART